MEPTRTLLRRLNGRPQACDQCRARKVACDHGQPTCNQCRRRDEPCVYTPDPRTMARSRRHTSFQAHVSPVTASAPGYLGFTSHSAVFAEARNNLSLLNGSEIASPGPGPNPGPARGTFTETPHLREMCLYVLKNVPLLRDIVFFPISPCYPDEWIHIAVKRILRALQDMYAEYHKRGDDGLDEMARVISDNTTEPLQDNYADAYGWIDGFAGPNIRWESLGLLWTLGELTDGLTQSPVSNAAPSPVIMACLRNCFDLARHFSQPNDILLYMSYRLATMESMVTGDASIACSNYHAQSIALMTFLGLHADTETPHYRPTLCSENKRRMFAYIFNIDKVMVSFTGRPPLISRRYVSTPLPLDLADSDLLGGDEQIQRAVAALDERGWNVHGPVTRSSFSRARYPIATIRDEVLEIALRHQVTTSIDRLLEIKARQLTTMAQLPDKIIYRPGNLADENADADIMFTKMLVWLEHLLNILFIERLLLRHGRLDEGDLLVASFEMVTMTLLFWKHQDFFTSYRHHFAWLLMQYAAPGGGILCLELLKPTFRGTHPKDPQVTRSSIIQQLSLLVGFLDWVRPSASNGALCADSKAVIQRVLDQTLNTDGSALETFDWGSMQVDFNFDLLDTFDWLQD